MINSLLDDRWITKRTEMYCNVFLSFFLRWYRTLCIILSTLFLSLFVFASFFIRKNEFFYCWKYAKLIYFFICSTLSYSNQNMYNRSISFKVLFWKAPHIKMTLIDKRQTIFNQLNIMVPYVDIIGLCHSIAILWKIYVRWLRFLFKRHANNGTWFILMKLFCFTLSFILFYF